MKFIFAITLMLNSFMSTNPPDDTLLVAPAPSPTLAEDIVAEPTEDGLVEFAGTVTDFIREKGTGVVVDQNDRKYPFHSNGGTLTTVKKGDKVTFLVRPDPRKKYQEASGIKKKKP